MHLEVLKWYLLVGGIYNSFTVIVNLPKLSKVHKWLRKNAVFQ